MDIVRRCDPVSGLFSRRGFLTRAGAIRVQRTTPVGVGSPDPTPSVNG